jgi:hypothetical protein
MGIVTNALTSTPTAIVVVSYSVNCAHALYVWAYSERVGDAIQYYIAFAEFTMGGHTNSAGLISTLRAIRALPIDDTKYNTSY